MKRNMMYPSASMQCDEEAIIRAHNLVVLAHRRYQLAMAAGHLRSSRRLHRPTRVDCMAYCKALDQVWAAQLTVAAMG